MADISYLADSSAWVQLMRSSGDPSTKERMRQLLADGNVVWCDIVRVELWRGAKSDADFRTLRALEVELDSLEITAEVWEKCCDFARKCRRKGMPVPTTDMLVYSCAAVHGAQVIHRDRHFEMLAQLDDD